MPMTMIGLVKALESEMRNPSKGNLPDSLADLALRMALNNSAEDDRRGRIAMKLNEFGEPVCPVCREATNRAYVECQILPCWNCGAVVFNWKPPKAEAK